MPPPIGDAPAPAAAAPAAPSNNGNNNNAGQVPYTTNLSQTDLGDGAAAFLTGIRERFGKPATAANLHAIYDVLEGPAGLRLAMAEAASGAKKNKAQLAYSLAKHFACDAAACKEAHDAALAAIAGEAGAAAPDAHTLGVIRGLLVHLNPADRAAIVEHGKGRGVAAPPAAIVDQLSRDAYALAVGPVPVVTLLGWTLDLKKGKAVAWDGYIPKSRGADPLNACPEADRVGFAAYTAGVADEIPVATLAALIAHACDGDGPTLAPGFRATRDGHLYRLSKQAAGTCAEAHGRYRAAMRAAAQRAQEEANRKRGRDGAMRPVPPASPRAGAVRPAGRAAPPDSATKPYYTPPRPAGPAAAARPARTTTPTC